MITSQRINKPAFQTLHSKEKSEKKGKFWTRYQKKQELKKKTGLSNILDVNMEDVFQFVKINSPSRFSKGEMEKDSFKQKVIQQKIFSGSHLGHCRSQNSQDSLRRGEIQNCFAGVRGDLSIFRPLSSQRYILKTLFFLLELLEKGGRVLVVDTGDRSLSLFSWSEQAELYPFLSSQEQQELVSNGFFLARPSLAGRKGKLQGKATPPFPFPLHYKCKGQHVKCNPFSPEKEFAWSGEKWFGGALTNWAEISKKIYQFATLLKQLPSDTVSLSSRFEKWMRGFPGFLSALAKQPSAFPSAQGMSSPQSQPSEATPTLEMSGSEATPYIKNVGGTLKNVRSNPLHYKCRKHIDNVTLDRRAAFPSCAVEAWKLPKKVEMQRKIRLRLGKQVDGILLINPNENRDVIAEARLRKIPVIGFADSITNLSGVDLSIPINLSSISETFIFLSILFQLGGRLNGGSQSKIEKKSKSHLVPSTTSKILSKRYSK